MNLTALLTLLLSPSARPSLGVSRTSRSVAYALTVASGKRPARVVWAGRDLLLWVQLIAPPIVQGDLGNTPVFLTRSPLDGKDAETWIDANESTVIPQGISPDQVVVEYAVVGTTICTATILKTARDETASIVEKDRPLLSLGVPLWNIARLYGNTVKTPFILWRLASDGSVLGFIRDGVCEKLLNCFINRSDFEGTPDRSATTIMEFISQLKGNDSSVPIVQYSPEHDFVVPKNGDYFGIPVLPVPTIRHVPEYCHEAFANALADDTGLNCISFEGLQKARKLQKRDHTLRSMVRVGMYMVVAFGMAVGLFDGLFFLIEKKYGAPMERLATASALLKATEKRHDALRSVFKEKARFSTERSRTTELLSDLQLAFPENVWAESITLTGQDQERYLLDINAVTTESGLINDALGTLGKMRGITDARLLSSEQVKLPDRTPAVRFSMKARWRFDGLTKK